MKSKTAILSAALAACSVTGIARADQALDNVNVTQLGTYGHATSHYVWVNGGAVTAECQASGQQPVFSFDESLPGGKSLFATLTTALVNNRKILVRASGCTITEVYLR